MSYQLSAISYRLDADSCQLSVVGRVEVRLTGIVDIGAMGDYAKLLVWKKAHRLTLDLYHCTAAFPSSERFELTNQLRRSGTSVAANIAEGCGRNTDGEMAYFVRIALGSANEVEYQLLLARDLGFLNNTRWQRLHEQTGEIKRMLAALLRTLRPR